MTVHLPSKKRMMIICFLLFSNKKISVLSSKIQHQWGCVLNLTLKQDQIKAGGQMLGTTRLHMKVKAVNWDILLIVPPMYPEVVVWRNVCTNKDTRINLDLDVINRSLARSQLSHHDRQDPTTNLYLNQLNSAPLQETAGMITTHGHKLQARSSECVCVGTCIPVYLNVPVQLP